MNDQAAREEEFFAHCDCCLKDCYPIKADFGGYFCGHCYKFALHYHKENAALKAENERLRSRLAAAEALAKDALMFAQSYANENPKWHDYKLNVEQDPSGVHEWLKRYADWIQPPKGA